MTRPVLLLVPLALLAGLVAGCERFTRQNYETLFVGQQETEVRQVLGEPRLRTPTVWIYEHDHPYYKAVLRFGEGKLVGKTWTFQRPEEKLKAESWKLKAGS
jgi:hypothetical protein